MTMEARKDDNAKPRFDLIYAPFEEAIARVMTGGAVKYEERNYLGLNDMRLVAAVRRHLNAYVRGEDLDPESGESHLVHAACGLMMIFEKRELGLGEDDRWPPRQRILEAAEAALREED